MDLPYTWPYLSRPVRKPALIVSVKQLSQHLLVHQPNSFQIWFHLYMAWTISTCPIVFSQHHPSLPHQPSNQHYQNLSSNNQIYTCCFAILSQWYLPQNQPYHHLFQFGSMNQGSLWHAKVLLKCHFHPKQQKRYKSDALICHRNMAAHLWILQSLTKECEKTLEINKQYFKPTLGLQWWVRRSLRWRNWHTCLIKSYYFRKYSDKNRKGMFWEWVKKCRQNEFWMFSLMALTGVL